MKQIGTTNTFGVIVELTQPEFRAIETLIAVAKNKVSLRGIDYAPTYTAANEDTETLLAAIIEWMQIADRANDLRYLADQIDAAIKAPEKEAKP